jgi:hypothetical protein
VADVEAQAREPGELERRAQQALDLEVGVRAGGAVELGADLDRLARRARACG